MDILALMEVFFAGVMWGSSCLFVSAFNKAGLISLETHGSKKIVSLRKIS